VVELRLLYQTAKIHKKISPFKLGAKDACQRLEYLCIVQNCYSRLLPAITELADRILSFVPEELPILHGLHMRDKDALISLMKSIPKHNAQS
jgi:hypothetical protein